MKVLIDECAARALKEFPAAQEFECLTVQKAGWSGKVNGNLWIWRKLNSMPWSQWIQTSGISKT